MRTYILIFNQTGVINPAGHTRGDWASVDVKSESDLAATVAREFNGHFAPIKSIVDITDPINPFSVILNADDRAILGLLANCLE